MLSPIRHAAVRSFFAVILITSLLFLSVPLAVAADSGKDEAKPSRDRNAEIAASADVKAPNVLSAAFEGAGSIAFEPPPAPAVPVRFALSKTASAIDASFTPMAAPTSMPLPAASTAPMTAKEKFEKWFHSRFLSFGAYGSAVANGMWKELQDNDDFKKDTVENFFADSMTRAARSYTFGTTAAFYEKAVLASLFRQDPRYHRSGRKGAGARIGYAVTRVFVTQGDRCGCDQFNVSFLLGGAGAAVTANLWERSERTGPMHTISRWYNHIAITALFNVVREFVGGQ